MDPASTAPSRPDRRRSRRRGALVLLLAASSLATFGATAASLALFTDTEATTGDFTTGTIDLALDDTTVFQVTDLMPGDVRETTLNVSNGGTADFRYAMSSTATADADDLGGQIVLTVRAGACPSTGTTLYSGALDVALFGDPTPGDDLGDRFLAAGDAEDLCFSAELPDTTGNDFQGTSVTMEFTFDAEQTANN